jgi:hypothetical protein
MAAFDKQGYPCPKCPGGVLRAKDRYDMNDNLVQCCYCSHTEERWAGKDTEPEPEPSLIDSTISFMKRYKWAIAFASLIILTIIYAVSLFVKQHIYESPERAVLQELADRYNVPRPGLMVYEFDKFHWNGENRLRTIGYYRPSRRTIYILPCSRNDPEEWLELIHHEFVHYYLDETNYRGDGHGPAFMRVMHDLGYRRGDITFDSRVCTPEHAT